MGINMKTQKHIVEPGTGIRPAIEAAILEARALNRPIIIEMNDARFCVNPDTKIQGAIDTYLEVKKKMFETKQLLEQKTR